jgi:hypothetical protein
VGALSHTGDISHLSNEREWGDADQVIKSANKEVFFLPGEHDGPVRGWGEIATTMELRSLLRFVRIAARLSGQP